MQKKIVAVWLSLAMMFGLIVIIVEIAQVVTGSSIIYVDDEPGVGPGNPPENYTSIQAAIDNASYGDTLFVYNGTYYENVVVNKTINLTGEDWDNTIIDGDGGLNVVKVTVDRVNISGFNIINGIYGIHLDSSSNNTITGNNLSSNNIFGIFLSSSSNNTLLSNKISSNNEEGIHLESSSNNNIEGNNVFSNDISGIYLLWSSNNTITNNNVSNNKYGIKIIVFSDNNIISENNISNNGYGIHIDSSSSNNITNNYISNEYGGIQLYWSLNTSITYNNFLNNGVLIWGYSLSDYNTHNIPTNNLVNGKPLNYYKNINGLNIDGLSVGQSIGQLIFANCTNVTVKNMQINNTDVGIEITCSQNATIINNSFSNNVYGIYLALSTNNNITHNNGLNNGAGIYLYSSSLNTLIDNNILLGRGHGICLSYSSNNNYIANNNIYLNNQEGIFLKESSFNNISGNILSSNRYNGIFLWDLSNNNTIIGNIIWKNGAGVSIVSSLNNIFYHNHFLDNGCQAYDETINRNQWDNGYPSGGNYWSDFDEPGEGAYDDYQGPDQDVLGSDGKVDKGLSAGGGKNPYVIDADSQDYYPLIEPIERFIILNQGWNLISIPLIQEEQSLTYVLDSIDGLYDAVQWYDITDTDDPWKHHKVGKPFGNDLYEINETMGFWVHITQPGITVFFINGTRLIQNQTITLYPGWNLVGFPSLTSYNRTVGLNNLTFGQEVDLIQWHDSSTQTWQDMDEDDNFVIGRGYWIHANNKCEWEVPL